MHTPKPMAHLEAGLLEVSDQSSLQITIKQRLVVAVHICSSCFVQDRLSPSESDSTSMCPSSQTLHPPNSCITQLDSLSEYRSWTPMQKSKAHRFTQTFSIHVVSSEQKWCMGTSVHHDVPWCAMTACLSTSISGISTTPSPYHTGHKTTLGRQDSTRLDKTLPGVLQNSKGKLRALCNIPHS